MHYVSRIAYYAVISEQRAKKLTYKMERTVYHINDVEYMFETVSVNGIEVAQCVEFGSEAFYLVNED